MAVNLVEKYGVIPQSLFPESYSSSMSSKLNTLLTSKLREFAFELRQISEDTSVSSNAVRRRKEEMMSDVYNTLSVCLGTPPKVGEKLSWEYYDKDGKFGSWEGTSTEFFEVSQLPNVLTSAEVCLHEQDSTQRLLLTHQRSSQQV